MQASLGARHPRLVRALGDGEFTFAVGTKLTLSNWVTPDVVRYVELLMHLGPKGLPHVYFTSGRDEMIDKAIRCLRIKRPQADVVLGLERQYPPTSTSRCRRCTSTPASPSSPSRRRARSGASGPTCASDGEPLKPNVVRRSSVGRSCR